MFLLNEKGETLVEVIVSMVILVIIVMTASTLTMHSMNSSTRSLDLIEDMNAEALGIETNTLDSSEVEEFSAEMSIRFKITDNMNFTVVPENEYSIAENIKASATENGLIFFEFE